MVSFCEKWLDVIVKVVCLLALFVQLGFNLQGFLQPKFPTTLVKDLALKDLDDQAVAVAGAGLGLEARKLINASIKQVPVDKGILKSLQKGGFADRYTNLHDYIRWRLVKFNDHGFENTEEFYEAVKSLKAGEPVSFTLVKQEVRLNLFALINN